MSSEQPTINTETKEPIEQESFDLGKEFVASGGEVLEWYPDNSPKCWKCGRGANDEIIDPKGMRRKALHYKNGKGEWEAGNPDEQLLAEIKRWRSDWMD